MESYLVWSFTLRVDLHSKLVLHISTFYISILNIWVDDDGCKQVLHQCNHHLIKSHAQHHPWPLDWHPSKLQLDHHGNDLQEALHGAPCQEVTTTESLFHPHSLPVSPLQPQTLHQAMAPCQVRFNLREIGSHLSNKSECFSLMCLETQIWS